jgi:protocatechuate 3,4-dioxygenase beta subunit
MAHENQHFDGNLRTDVATLMSRRRLLGIGAAGLALTGCDNLPFIGSAEADKTASAADGSVCIKLPQETNGPFPADGTNARAGVTVNVLDQMGVIRPDMRASFGAYSDVADGVPLTLSVRLVNVNGACTPLANHIVYFWQCDAAGQYSLYERTDSNRLRGAALTDASGMARMLTIVPGCYRGRWPHIHFEVFASPEKAASGADSILTSQFAFSKSDCDAVYAAHSAYGASPPNFAELSLESDMVFRDSTPEQIKAQMLTLNGDTTKGYVTQGTIGLLA